jgi:hypothetical protein
MSNKSAFNEACDLFNKRDWNLANKLDQNVECHYLNPSTATTYTRQDFIDHQTSKPQTETFDPKNQGWNDDDSVVTGTGNWTDDGTTAHIVFKFTFKNGLINYMWGAIIP